MSVSDSIGNFIYPKSNDNEDIILIRKALMCIALCHNVTPVYSDVSGDFEYQASSPDEVALLKFTESVGITLIMRTLNTIVLLTPAGEEHFEILQFFPFTSENRKQGVIVKSEERILLYVKGAESVLAPKVNSDWMQEHVDSLAKDGLRTLVFAEKELSLEEYDAFALKYNEAKSSLHQRDSRVRSVLNSLEQGMNLLAITGVEDRLQDQGLFLLKLFLLF